MSSETRALADALQKLLVAAGGELPAGRLSQGQGKALAGFSIRTGAVQRVRKGAGHAFIILNRTVVEVTCRGMRPTEAEDVDQTMPLRAQNIASHRSSKARRHGHEVYHLLIKPIGGSPMWRDGNGAVLDLTTAARLTGVTALSLVPTDTWETDAPLWLVENSALFSDTSWVPPGAKGTLALYNGILDGRLLRWLGARRRHAGIVMFADYDGVGLQQYARLVHTAGNQDAEFWLFPEWSHLLRNYGSAKVWRDTYKQFVTASEKLKQSRSAGTLGALMEEMSCRGLALEQEAIWLRGSPERKKEETRS